MKNLFKRIVSIAMSASMCMSGGIIASAHAEDNAGYVRTALVAYNAYFADGSDFRKKEYLYKIVYDAFKNN